jgi:hypothetical protein
MRKPEADSSSLQTLERDHTPLLQFGRFSGGEGVQHAVFTRKGGFSRGAFHSLNTSYGVGDCRTAVRRNRQKLQRILDTPALVFVRQVHGTDVRIVTENNLSDFSRNEPPRADALITNTKGICLGIQVADCQPILLWDPRREVVANVHSGWRGSVQNIVGRTVAVMQARFDCRPQEMIAAIGPSLGPCCSEFVHYRREIPERFWQYKDTADHFDFWAITRDQLQAAGLDAKRIVSSDLCTRCNTERFFSYRGEGQTGRFAAVVGLR